ncbi:DUF1631 domain-containing protein [Pseudoxanthomonas koreensis]|uniref:DUF1631 domain-containing protein n=1 Tax=Pseudoxanthomonas koreensis TaxID=266061 RepID=UPI0013911EEE|nr:DUF1631 domain-containing protein [Pseudoxanthomonas koreensis]KAF1691024.1 thymidine phosphorylase [Pseudoxanthomonas koreensis]
MSPSQADPTLDPRFAPLLIARARDAFLGPLADAFAASVARYDDVLFDRAERAGTSQLLFLDGMRELRRRRDEIAAGFRAQLTLAWRALEAGTPLSAEVALSGQSGGLSLVGEHELESRLAARNLASVMLRDCKAVLSRLDRRLGWIAGGLELDADSNPASPEHIGVAVREAFAPCDLAPEVRLVLIKLCERDLAGTVAKLYEALDLSLVREGVLAGTPSGSARAPARHARTPERDAHGWADAAGDEYSPAWATRFMQRWQETRGAMQQHGVDVAGMGEGAAAGGSGMLLDALHQMLQHSRELRGGAEQAAGQVQAAAAGQRPLSQREMLSVLSLLQATPSASLSAAIGDEQESLSQRLKSEVLANASQLGVDPSNTRLDAKDEDAIDLVGMLFDVLLDERDLAGRPRELIGRLVVPFVKVALLDRRMFVQKTHPARRLLNALAEACEGNQGESAAERTLLAKVEDVTGRLVAEFNENLAIFMTLEEEFRDFLDQHRRRIEVTERRAAEIQRGQERLELARSRAEFEVRQRLQERQLPQAVADFLRNPWQHPITLALLREGELGDVFAEALELADGVLEELGEAQRHIVGKLWLQNWQPGLRQVFASVGLHGDAAEEAIGALHDTLQAVADARPELEKPLPELPAVALPQPAAPVDRGAIELVAGTDTLDFDNADAGRFRALPVGTWLDFIDREGRVQAGKRSWGSPISSRLLFVNRRGVRFCVASPEELAVMVRLGRLRTHVEDDGAFDSAMQGVIERLDVAAPAQAATLH